MIFMVLCTTCSWKVAVSTRIGIETPPLPAATFIIFGMGISVSGAVCINIGHRSEPEERFVTHGWLVASGYPCVENEEDITT